MSKLTKEERDSLPDDEFGLPEKGPTPSTQKLGPEMRKRAQRRSLNAVS